MEPDPARSSRALPGTLAWACYLGASWTWCIGMFLPVLLVRDFGAWCWLLFAVPNVAGAAAMAFVLRTREASREITGAHGRACVAFSLVTVAFHCFFLGWIGTLLPAAWFWAGYLLIAVLALVAFRGGAGPLGGAVLVTVLSLVVLVRQWAELSPREVLAQAPAAEGSGLSLAILAPAFFFGFLLCPYLDLTFHHARRSSPAPRAAFLLGFGVVFLAMIVLTLLYAVPLLDGWPGRLTLFHLVGFHMLVQSGLTAVLHLERVFRRVGRVRWRWTIPAAALGAVLFLVAPWLAARGATYGGMDARETIYWLFLAPYGLVFPAYVYLVVLRARAVPFARRLAVWAGAVVVALPMYWMGFVEREIVWLLPGVVVVLLARLALGRPPAGASTST